MEVARSRLLYIGVLVKLRICQAKKMVYELGNYAIFLSLALLLIIAFTYFVHRDEAGSQKLFFLLGLLVFIVHQTRKDKVFVLKHIAYPYIEMMLEYLLIVAPFVFFGIYFLRWQSILILFIFIGAIPYLNIVSKQIKYNRFISFIPTSMFEWKSGVRKMFLPFAFLYIVVLISSWFHILPLILMWVLTTMMMSFYDENESLQLLNEYGQTHVSFINKKIIQHVRVLMLLYGPPLIINIIFNPDYLLIDLLILMAQITLLVFAITTKYKNYVPNLKLINNSNFTAMMSLFGALPGFFLLPLAFTFYNYNKALINLKPYFEND